MKQILHNKKVLHIGMAVISIVLSLGLFWTSSYMDKRKEAIEKSNESVLAWERNHKEGVEWAELIKRGNRGTNEMWETASLKVNEIKEEEPEILPEGKIKKERVSLQGNFRQLMQSFDIIGDENIGTSFEILRIARNKDVLDITGELREFRGRGTYEEEKYSSHRTDGNREKPGCADSG